MRLVCSMVLVVGLAIPATAQGNRLSPTPIAADGSATAAKDKKDKLVCQTQEATGSRLGKKKVCRTAAEWAEINALDRRDVEKIQANRYNGNQ